MIRFYAPDLLENPVLPEQESTHCCRVLRMKEGETVFVVDGKGHCFECVITDAHPKHTKVEIISTEEEKNHWSSRIVLAVAPTKNIDRIEWLIEKVVEIGIDEIVLLNCEHSERKKVNEDRLDKIVVSAMKQSLKAIKPRFSGIIGFKEFLKETDTECRYFGYCDKDTMRMNFADSYPGGKSITILIGPEGDFSPNEVKEAIDAGFLPVTFGDSRLRTETAALFGVVATHVINSKKNLV